MKSGESFKNQNLLLYDSSVSILCLEAKFLGMGEHLVYTTTVNNLAIAILSVPGTVKSHF